MKTLTKLYQNPKQLFIVISGMLFLMFGVLLSPIVIARVFGTPVQLTYLATYVEAGNTMYPELSIQFIPKEELPPLLDEIFNASTEEEAFDLLSDVDFFYLVLDDVNGQYEVVDVRSTQPETGVYLQTQSVYFDYSRNFDQPSDVWQDNYVGIRFSLPMTVEVYIPQYISLSTRQLIVNGTAVVDAYIWNGQLYFVDFNV